MCGIAGIVGEIPAETTAITEMIRLLHHRGPDDSGVLTSEHAQLGHSRLSILDLSSAGHQPMELGDLVITYNGEIYNFRELRRDLPGPFRSDTDTEVLLHLFRQEGPRCLRRLHGMFAFAIWDEKNRRLFAARDRLGIKPLCYREIPGGLAFASELKSLLVLGHPSIRRESISDYLSYRYIPSPESVWEDIRKLEPAHYLLWEAGRLEIHRYWSPPETPDIDDEDLALEQLDELLRKVVREHTLADVPVGVFLSGGVDSAAITTCLDAPRTFTLRDEIGRRDEGDAAAALARHLGCHHSEESAGAPDLDEALETLPGLFDEPFSDSGAWASYLISKLARKQVKVALSGEGGDELFLGYKRHGAWNPDRGSVFAGFLARLTPPLSHSGRSLQRRGQSGFEHYCELASVFTRRQKEILRPRKITRESDDDWFVKRHWREDLEPYQRLRWLDLHSYLPEDLLTKLDRVSMAHSLEARPPFLDHRIVEFVMRLSPALLRKPGQSPGKLLLRRLIRDRLPPGHLDRRKQGFNLPIRSWLRRRPEILDSALDRLADAGFIRRPKFFQVGNEQSLAILLLDRWMQMESGG